jgi:hypothetical protein
LTRRRGDAEKNAEKNGEKSKNKLDGRKRIHPFPVARGASGDRGGRTVAALGRRQFPAPLIPAGLRLRKYRPDTLIM